ncbi:hypothetical protein [uncultured Subdoligranulum sp.]|nr:hypothetical protein [uncultured Subdoligranulum sp.]
MKNFCKLVALLVLAGGLLALMKRLCRCRKQHHQDDYITLYRSDD